MINFSTLQGLTIPEGVVTQIADASGRVLWVLQSGGKVVLQVEKITSDTYAGETTYTGEQFILLDIYPKTNGTVKVTYGGLTKTITDTSGVENPNAQTVYFGTLYGVTDSVATPTSGELTIEGNFYAFGCGGYYINGKGGQQVQYCACITAVTDLSGITSIPAMAFYGCTKITSVVIPDTVESIVDVNAFDGCTGLTNIDVENGNGFYSSENGVLFTSGKLMLVKYPLGKTSTQYTIPSSVTSIGKYAFYDCSTITSYTFPTSVRSIGRDAFYLFRGNRTLTFLGTTPPTLPTDINGAVVWPFGSASTDFVVPKGCGDLYRAAGYVREGYADRVTEAS